MLEDVRALVLSSLPPGTLSAKALYEVFCATARQASNSASVSVVTSTLFFLKTSTSSSSSFLDSVLKYSSAFFDAAISAACCLLSSLSQLFLEISTGSYMNHSALSPGAVTHLSCSYRRKDTKLPVDVSVPCATPCCSAL